MVKKEDSVVLIPFEGTLNPVLAAFLSGLIKVEHANSVD